MDKQPYRKAFWSHPSVLAITSDQDPVDAVMQRARDLVFRAMSLGWSGPPFDPLALADILKIPVSPQNDVRDARLIPKGQDGLEIEFNPNQSRARIRFSIAHELGHTLFPDCAEMVRHRAGRQEIPADDWQLEMLCNLAAAEFLMPIGSFPDLRQESLTIDLLLTLREQYAVSTEAVILRAVRLTPQPCIAFTASSSADEVGSRYVLDYTVPSRSAPSHARSGITLPATSVVRECTGIGFTATGTEVWPSFRGDLRVQCVGLPPYPGRRLPRVAGIASLTASEPEKGKAITVLKGDATAPRGSGNKIIAFVVNDRGLSWGAGFARAMQTAWPAAQREFASWAINSRREFRLGNCLLTDLDRGVVACMMLSQHGYGPSPTPRIRYGSLQTCLRTLAEEAQRRNASVHMPRIGSGEAGGSWPVIQEMIETELSARGIDVTIYELPGQQQPKPEAQKSLF